MELIEIPKNELTTFNEEMFKDLSAGGMNFLPRIQITQATAEVVKKKKIQSGVFGFFRGQEDPVDLGESVNLIPLSLRPKAMDFTSETPLAYHRPDSNEFAALRKRADGGEQNIAYGFEFLLWVPDVSDFATFLCGSKTLRPEARNIRPLIGQVAKFKTKYIEAKFSWYGMSVMKSPEPVSNMFTAEQLEAVLANFNNPQDSQVELADPNQPADDRVR